MSKEDKVNLYDPAVVLSINPKKEEPYLAKATVKRSWWKRLKRLFAV